MSNLQEIKTDYLCQCTVSISNEILPKQISETKENFNNVLNIHEIDEDDDCEDNIVHSNNLKDNEEDHETIKDKEKSSFDDEYAYTNESFYSDDSCDESEETASQFLISGSCSLYIDDNKCEENGKLENLNDEKEKEINYNEESVESISAERSERIQQSSEKNLEFVRRTRKKNMSFTDDEIRKIEHENELLLRKIMAQHQPRDKVLRKGTLPKMSSSAINRKKLQKKIEGDNMVLLRRIQQAKPCVISKSTTPGYRMTFI